MRIIDITTQYEYQAVLDILPLHIQELVRDKMQVVEEIDLDLGQSLQLKMDGLRVKFPIPITNQDLKYVIGRTGKFRDDGRRGLPRTLHRISGELNEENIPDKITIRVARAIMGVAEPLRDFIEKARGIAVIGPPAVGKTTLLRDIARIRSEVLGSGLIIIDSSNEVTGDGDIPHPMLNGVRRIKVGDPSQQAPKLKRAIRNHGPEEILVDEVGDNGDVPLLVSAANFGVTVIATMHGQVLRDVLENPPLYPLLGVSVDERTGEPIRRARTCFDTAIEVHAKGTYIVHTNLKNAVDEMIAGGEPEGIKIGNWPELEAKITGD